MNFLSLFSFRVGTENPSSSQHCACCSDERNHCSCYHADVTVTCCSLPPKHAVNFVHALSDASTNGCTMYESDPMQNSKSGVIQQTRSGMTEHSDMIQPSKQQPFCATVIGNQRLTAPDHWQDVRLLTFDIAGSHIV